MTNWKNRLSNNIEWVDAEDLIAHPDNPRRHPGKQRDALRGSLDAIGWAAPVLVSTFSNYTLDGMLRIEEAITRGEQVPVLYVNLESEEEENLFLASFDWITQLAEYDSDVLNTLLHGVSTDDERLQTMLSGMAAENGLIAAIAPEEFETYDEDIETSYCCPKCGYEWSGAPK